MRRVLEKSFDRIFRALVDRLHTDPRVLRDRLTLSLVDAYLKEQGSVRHLNDPFHNTKLCFELFSPLQVHIETIKWNVADNDAGALRFSRLVDQINDGLPSYSARLVPEILNYENTFSGMDDDMPTYGFDVNRHFHIASSFAPKGKLLFNIVRFMRPANCLEIGTAWGMSAYFMLQSLERHSPQGHLWTIEIDELQFQKSAAFLGQRFGGTVSCVYGSSHERLPSVINEAKSIDLYFHDGGHVFENIIGNFDQVKGSLRKGSVVLIDDIRWWNKSIHKNDPRCYEAWLRIAHDPMVCCAIELNQSVGMALIN